MVCLMYTVIASRQTDRKSYLGSGTKASLAAITAVFLFEPARKED